MVRFGVIVRLLQDGELLPQTLQTGFEPLRLDPQWCWIAVEDGEASHPYGILLGAEAHGLLLMLRIVTLPDAPVTTALRLIKTALRDASLRGLVGGVTMFSFHERKLAKIAERYGAQFIPFRGVIAVAPFKQ